MKFFVKIFLLFLFFLLPLFSFAQDDLEQIFKAEVVEVGQSYEEHLDFGVETAISIQDIKVKILEGQNKGEEIELRNEFSELSIGNKVFLKYIQYGENESEYSLYEIDRSFGLWFTIAFFIFVILFFSRMKGLRSLLALGGSILSIIYILIPAMMAGYNPIFVSVLVAGMILFFALFISHGFNRGSLIAFSGTIIAVIFTGILASVLISLTKLTGLGTEETVYLNIFFNGDLDFVGLLLGAIIIGMLGALDDVAITQVAVIKEFYKFDKTLSLKKTYIKGMRVGREHVSALVNTLVLAYTAVSLPILLLYSQNNESLDLVLSREIFATEIVRIVAGSIGLVLAVPITTVLAVYFLKPK